MPDRLSWRERARRVREGEHLLADAPAEVSRELMVDLFDTILRTSFDAVVLCDRVTGQYFEVSDSFCRITGLSRAELLGRTSVELGLVEPGGARQTAEADAAARYEAMYENVVTRRDGTSVTIEFTHTFLDEDYTIVIARDVTARKAREAALAQAARVDELTGVLNRRGFRLDLDQALAAAREGRYEVDDVAVMLLDADGLKQVNDELGHEYGDQLIITLAVTLRAVTAPHGVVGRLGGDEFAAFIPGTTREEGEAMAARLTAGLARHRIGPRQAERAVAASIGVVSAASTGFDAAAALAAADTRMYEAKRLRT